MTTVTERVAAGVALLDETRPGWERHINLRFLDLGDCWECVLGQEFAAEHDPDHDSPFGYGVEMLSLDAVDEARRYGFDGPGPEHAALTAEWRRVIEARRAGASDG
jgi:hypothetical protein